LSPAAAARTLARSPAAGATVKPTRVLLARLPRMLRDILREIIAAQPDMVIVAEADDAEDLVAATAPYAPDVLVVGLEASETQEVAHDVLRRAPWLRVLAIEAGGRRAWLHMLRPYQMLLGEVSPSMLLDAIRQPVGPIAEVATDVAAGEARGGGRGA
jgi:chemotaxis response regulator CheB